MLAALICSHLVGRGLGLGSMLGTPKVRPTFMGGYVFFFPLLSLCGRFGWGPPEVTSSNVSSSAPSSGVHCEKDLTN